MYRIPAMMAIINSTKVPKRCTRMSDALDDIVERAKLQGKTRFSVYNGIEEINKITKTLREG